MWLSKTWKVTIRKDGDIVTSMKRAPKRYLGIEWRAYYFASGMKNIHQGNWTCDLEYLDGQKRLQSQSSHFKRNFEELPWNHKSFHEHFYSVMFEEENESNPSQPEALTCPVNYEQCSLSASLQCNSGICCKNSVSGFQKCQCKG